MKTVKIALFLIFACNIYLPAQDDISKSIWCSHEIKIDGSHRDWNIPFQFYDKLIGMRFDIYNNSSRLFIFLMTNEPTKISKLINAGMQIQLSSKEKGKKFSAVINIPGLEIEGEMRPQIPNEKRNDNDFLMLVNKYKLQLPGIKTKGFKTKNGDMPLIDNNGIAVGIGADSLKNLCYEISLPLNELITGDLIKLEEILQLNIKVNGIAIPGEENKSSEGISDNRTYAGMYGYVNNYRSMYRGGGKREVHDIFTENTYKLKFRLSGK